jgi:putative ABC transport system permease protein
MIPDLRRVVATIDTDLPLSNVSTYDDLIGKTYSTKRLALVIVSLFSGAALFLAAVGLYAVLSYSVSQRIREIGVQIALGAKPIGILTLVTRQGIKIVGIGLIAGILVAFVLAHLIGSVLYGVSPNDPVALALSIFVLGLTGLLACLLPALRATRIDPIIALGE